MSKFFTSFIFLLSTIFCTPILAQEIGNKAKVVAQYDSVHKAFPKEKIYLHLDKAVYAP